MNSSTRHEILPDPLPFLLLTAALLIALPVSADVPRHFSYQGVLTDDAGNPLPGPVTLRVRLYDAAIGGPTVFDETHPVVELDGGVYSISIGSKTTGGIPDSVVASSEVWLGVSVDDSGTVAEIQYRFFPVRVDGPLGRAVNASGKFGTGCGCR